MAGRTKGGSSISPHIIESVLIDFYKNHMSYLAIAKKYNISDHTVANYVKKHPELKETFPTPTYKPPITPDSREEIKSLPERAQLILDLTFQAMEQMLRDYPEKFTASQLTQITQAVSPYAMPRKDKDKGGAPKTNIYKLFKESVKTHGKINSVQRN